MAPVLPARPCIGTTVIALLALLAPEERRASILNFSLLPSQLSWFVGPITRAALASIWLRLPFVTGALALGVAMVLALYTARGVGAAERGRSQDSYHHA